MQYCVDCRPANQHDCDEGAPSSSEASPESSDGEEEVDKEEALAEAEFTVEFSDSLPALPPLPAEGLVRHVVTQNVHRAVAVGVEVPRCNLRVAAASLEWLAEWPANPWPVCRRKGCLFVAAL